MSQKIEESKLIILKEVLELRKSIFKANMRYLRNEKFDSNAGRYEEVEQILKIVEELLEK